MVKYDLKKEARLGILGGTFDPAHKGHLMISKVAKKLFKLDRIVWAITEKNPFKSKSFCITVITNTNAVSFVV